MDPKEVKSVGMPRLYADLRGYQAPSRVLTLALSLSASRTWEEALPHTSLEPAVSCQSGVDKQALWRR